VTDRHCFNCEQVVCICVKCCFQITSITKVAFSIMWKVLLFADLDVITVFLIKTVLVLWLRCSFMWSTSSEHKSYFTVLSYVNGAIMQWSEFQYCCVAQLILVFCGCFEDSYWEWFLCSDKIIVKSIAILLWKSIGIAIANTFLPKYWHYFWEVLLTSLVKTAAC